VYLARIRSAWRTFARREMSLPRIFCALLMLQGLSACAILRGHPAGTRLSDDLSYYGPFDNAGQTGPTYLIGPPPPGGEIIHRSSGVIHAESLPTIPDRSLPPSCLS